MLKLFVSQPMADKTDEQIIAERAHLVAIAEKKLGEKVEVIDSFFKDNPYADSKNSSLHFLAESLHLMAEADAAVFAKGWQLARGCRIEHLAASFYGIREVLE